MAAEAEEFTAFLADLAQYPLDLEQVAATGRAMIEKSKPGDAEKLSVQHF